MRIDIITIFPKMFEGPLSESILKRAQIADKIEIKVHDLRDWAEGVHKQVDDKPFGGGAGMVMMVEPLYKAIKAVKGEYSEAGLKDYKILLTAAKGEMFNQTKAQEFSKLDALCIIAGHYEGVDERVAQHLVDGEISIGQYVLTGGELPAMVITDAVARLIPGVLGNEESLLEESYSSTDTKEYPHYTRPALFTTEEGEEWPIPDVLKSGNHAEIKKWRDQHRADILSES